MTPLRQWPASASLEALQSGIAKKKLTELFNEESDRFDRYSLEAAGLFLDYSKNWINTDVLASLMAMAGEAGLSDAVTDMYSGKQINGTERRAVLHTALRCFDDRPCLVDGEDVMPKIRDVRERMKRITDQVHREEWLGFTGKPIRHVVNIGIGGSYLGLKTVINALTPYHKTGLSHHFIANIDPSEVSEVLRRIDPETTLFIVASKSFSTLETLQNAKACRAFMLEKGCPEAAIRKHFVAISTNLKAIGEFGIAEENTLPLWDWVGGRYSLWSAIGLMISLVVGFDHFQRLLSGASAMDRHFSEAPLERNMPVILGMLGIWYHNYFGAETHAVISYDYFLRDLPGHLQQMDMESNGKQVDRGGRTVTYQTGPVIWGGTGTNDQHAYHQLLHQGTRLIPVDFIVTANSHNPVGDQHRWLLANALAQSQAMMQGKSAEEIKRELLAAGVSREEAERLAPHKAIPGNRPNNIIMVDKSTPETVGALIALYEHKVFVQGTLWQINSFDQWGVELGKVLGDRLFNTLSGTETDNLYDASTRGLIQRCRSLQGA